MIEDLKSKIQEYGLTPEQYESCLSDAYAKANHIIDLDWQEIIDKYELNIHYDTLRKATQTIFGGAFVYEYFKSKKNLNNKKREKFWFSLLSFNGGISHVKHKSIKTWVYYNMRFLHLSINFYTY